MEANLKSNLFGYYLSYALELIQIIFNKRNGKDEDEEDDPEKKKMFEKLSGK